MNSSTAPTPSPSTTTNNRKYEKGETCPSFRRGHIPSTTDLQRLRQLSAPHVDSFNFFLERGLPAAIADIQPVEVDLINPSPPSTADSEEGGEGGGGGGRSGNTTVHKDGYGRIVTTKRTDTLRIWVENVRVSHPVHAHQPATSSSGGGRHKAMGMRRLYPRDCRELGLMYSGPMMGDFCFQVNHRTVTTVSGGEGEDGDDDDGYDDGVGNPHRRPQAKQTNSTMEEVRGKVVRSAKKFGDMPIMVTSKACHLHGTKPADLIRLKEEDNEFGGYFIVNGIERCVRLLQIPRSNHPTAIQRTAFKKRGPTYTDLGVAIRSSRHNGDQTSVTNTVHYLTTGGASLKFTARKQEFLIPVILVLRSLSSDRTDGSGGGVTDEELYQRIIQTDPKNTFLRARAELLLQDARRYTNLHTPAQCLSFLGSRFRSIINIPDSTPDVAVGHHILNRYVLIHLQTHADKLECLLFLLRKLYSFAAGDCKVDNADSLQNQELLLPGHLLTGFVKEKFEELLVSVRGGLMRDMRMNFTKLFASLNDIKFWNRMVDRMGSLSNGGIGQKVKHFLSTGNIISSTGLDLMQVSGYTIVAERLNFLRYCAHFRSVHRGQFFMEMKTTAVRKLLPDQWGFLCPVHTPDGGPCGLLSHLALRCEAVSFPHFSPGSETTAKEEFEALLISLGVAPLGAGGSAGDGRAQSTPGYLTVCIDGKIIGGATARRCKAIAVQLRAEKVNGDAKSAVPKSLEIVFIAPNSNGGPYPGLFLFSGAARLIRPVLNRAYGKTELIGPMEQPFMDIACLPSDIQEGITTHQEIDPNNILSLIASLTPFSDYNQSPRNMYQCQMGKQTMGTPCHSFPYRTDNKLYRLHNPQAPIAQTARHAEYKMDEYPNGTNAVVAVLSYTGFDMEDAMILNKSSYERGFGHASVYKTLNVDIKSESERAGASSKGDKPRMRFSNKKLRSGLQHQAANPLSTENDNIDSNDEKLYPTLADDGLPEIGGWVKQGEPIYCVVDELTGRARAEKHKEKEAACIQSVRLLGQPGPLTPNVARDDQVSITLRIPRNPVIGDKFSSRHGQKGVLSVLWPQIDMPFSESGISPDIIINPHAFPSRMTIGMLIESMAGKSGALHGMYQDATPFSFHESGDQIAVDYFGEQLLDAGYSFYGSEPLYSGVSGCLMQADLYIGIVYYQRLRHMVSDKYQVRATGKVNALTRQPVKGRQKGGGIRLGEMERDSLLSHGTAFLLHDRLLNCSDRHVAYACRRCGDLLSPTTERCTVLSAGQAFDANSKGKAKLRVFCRNPKCSDVTMMRENGNDEMVEPIALPYVFRYLTNELAGMNIKMTLDIQ